MVGKTILIVDDEAPIREMIAVALEMAGYECLEAENTQQAHAVIVDRKPAEMGPTEYRLLQFFMTHQERAYTRGQLLDQVWGGNVYVEERTVDVHIRRLRKALGEVYENLVQTVRGTGYRFSTKS
ncbi:TPA: winged helix-turn-helix domain-containing protein [Pseudomonas aeruginosa]|nr:winged helix-turn-helix domain-containing protein [Pseudomonas aeruginosa]